MMMVRREALRPRLRTLMVAGGNRIGPKLKPNRTRSVSSLPGQLSWKRRNLVENHPLSQPHYHRRRSSFSSFAALLPKHSSSSSSTVLVLDGRTRRAAPGGVTRLLLLLLGAVTATVLLHKDDFAQLEETKDRDRFRNDDNHNENNNDSGGGGGAGAHNASTKFGSPATPPGLFPLVLLQAMKRAARLGYAAGLVAWDYHRLSAADASPKSNDDTDNNDWERLVELRRQALRDAQEAAAATVPSLEEHNLDPDERRRRRKQAVQQAAREVVEAEDQLLASQAGRTGRHSDVHQKAAQRLLHLCQVNGGVYIKVGQHLANLDYLLPPEYIETLSVLFDQNPHTPFEDVREVIKEDLGQYPEDLFDDFDPAPIASASLAQVHVAYDKQTGQKLAVKVQHRGLRETSVGDVSALVMAVRLAERLFPDTFTLGWLADEIAPQLPKELDFVREGRNAERAAQDLSTTGLQCVVPEIWWYHTAPRVLTMDFEGGCKATDAESLQQLGLRKRDVAQLISSVFASQMFLSGFVHCDPHPANVLVRAQPNGKPELVLLDHGLYRELDDDFRRTYAELWKCLLLADLDGIRDSCRGLGVGHAYPLFAAVLTARPFDEVVERSRASNLHLTGASTARSSGVDRRADKAVIRGYAQRYLRDIVALLGTVPRQTLLLLKTNDCLRHIDLSLGSPTNTLAISGRYAALSLYRDRLRTIEGGSLSGRVQAWWTYMRVLARIQLCDAAAWWFALVHWGEAYT